MMLAQAPSFSSKASWARWRATFMSGAVTRTIANADAFFTGPESRACASKRQCEVASRRGPGRSFGFNHQACDQPVSVAPREHHGGRKLPAQDFIERPQ